MFDRNFTSEGDANEWVTDCQDPTESSQRSKYVQQQKEAGLIPNTWEHQQRMRAEEDETPKNTENSNSVLHEPSTVLHNLSAHSLEGKRGNNYNEDRKDSRVTHKVQRDLNDRWKIASKFLYSRNKNKFLSKCLDCYDKDPLFISRILDT